MARPVLSPEQIEQFRTRAADVSLKLFVEEGYQRFSMRSLARELGCSHTTPYRYFESKAEIFAAARAEGFRRFAAFLRERLAVSTDPEERLRILARAYFDFAQQHSMAFTVIFEMGQPAPQTYPFVDEAGFAAWSVLLAVVREAVEAQLLCGDVGTLAHVMWAGIHGVATLELARKLRMGRSAKIVIESMMEALINAHRAPAVGSAAASSAATGSAATGSAATGSAATEAAATGSAATEAAATGSAATEAAAPAIFAVGAHTDQSNAPAIDEGSALHSDKLAADRSEST